MKLNLLFLVVWALALEACHTHSHDNENGQGHNHEIVENHESEHDHDHEQEQVENHNDHDHVKVKYTAYTGNFELFAEADAFVAGEKANILSHFSKLPSFKPLESGEVTAILTINGREVKQTLPEPARTGIYSFDVTPVNAGIGSLRFQIDTAIIQIKGVQVYAGHHEAHEQSTHQEPSMVNRVAFTKEQSWKIDFKSEEVRQVAFGQAIKTVAEIQPQTANEKVIVAKTDGIVLFPGKNLLEGNPVMSGETILEISSGGISEDNIYVKMTEAKNNFENAEADFMRKKELAEQKIISQKEWLNTKNAYENAKAIYENLKNNFSSAGQSAVSPISGFVKQIFVENGQFVETGEPLLRVVRDQKLVLKAFVQQKYSGILSQIHSATIKTPFDNQTYPLEELNGKVLSYGKSVSPENFLIPVYLQIDNKADFVQGSLVEVFLKTVTNEQAITVPNSALLEEQGNYFVFVQVTPELFEKRQIKTGGTDGIRTEVISGLMSGERIISKGAMLVNLAQASGALDPHSGHVH